MLDEDPIEAEALLVRYVRDARDRRMARAAAYDLFYLRLRHGRLAEAFSQSDHKHFARPYSQAVSGAFSLSEVQAGRLLRHLRRVCAQSETTGDLGDFLRSGHWNSAVWDFSLRVLYHCKAKMRSEIFAPDLFEQGGNNRAQTALRLIAIREQMRTDPTKAAQLLGLVRESYESDNDPGRRTDAQISLLEARVAAATGDFSAVTEKCSGLGGDSHPPYAIRACRFLRTHAFLSQGDAQSAWREIRKAKLKPTEIDNRLLRLLAAVAAGVEKPAKLLQFSRRASYPYCALSLRELAREYLEQKPAK